MLAALAAAIAVPALVILYFLKLRRVPREVSTTMLWKKSIQDLQANAPFQKLRRNILLLLQLIILAMLLLALAQPRSVTASGAGRKLVIFIDRSASMRAVDPGADPATRLDRAKDQALKLVASLRAPSIFEDSGAADEAMVIAFGPSAEIVAPMTSDPRRLERAIESITPTDGPTRIEDAYHLARSRAGANTDTPSDTPADAPDQTDEGPEPGQDPGATPWIHHIFSDGRISDLDAVRAGARGRAPPAFVYHRVGAPDAPSIGIVSLQAERDYDEPSTLSLFVGVQSTDTRARTVDAELLIDGSVRAVRAVELDPATTNPQSSESESDDTESAAARPTIRPSTGGVVFELNEPDGVLATVRIATGHDDDPARDTLGADNEGTLVIPPARRARVALVTTGSLFLREAISGLPIAEFEVMTPAAYESRRDAGRLGAFDLFVFDRALPQPTETGAPFEPGRYLVMGAVPTAAPSTPSNTPSNSEPRSQRTGGIIDKGTGPTTQIINWRRAHPLLRDLTLDAVVIGESRTVELPEDSAFVSLAETTEGPAILELSTGDVRAVVVPFDPAMSNWPFDVSFVVFLAGAVDYLGASDAGEINADARRLVPGRVLADRVPQSAEDVRVTLPGGTRSEPLAPAPDGRVVFGPIERIGIYELTWTGPAGATDETRSGRVVRRFAANLLDARESETGAASALPLSDRVVDAAGDAGVERLREWWPWLLAAALAVMLVEWWVYNRKVYL